MGLNLAGVLAAVVLVAGGGHPATSARPIVFGTEASNKHLAEVQAERELRSVMVPAGAHRVESSPVPVLDEAVETSGEPNLVQRWEWLVASGTVRETARWFRTHAPADSYLERHGGLGSPKESGSFLGFETSGRSRRVYAPSVIVAITGLSDGRVAIRLEVQQVWKTPHPAAAKVSGAARILYVARSSGGGKPRQQVIRAPRRVRRVARAINQLPAVQPQVVYCPEYSYEHPVEVTMRFKAREGGPVLAEATQRVPLGCGESMGLTVRGDSRTFGLDFGERAIDLLHH
jgi:hypothetical protein